MGDHDDGLALPHQLQENVEDGLGGLVESSLPVGSSATRMGGSFARAAGNCHPLLLPAGNFRRQLAGMLFQFHLAQQLQRPCLAAPAVVAAAKIHGQHDVIQQGKGGHQVKRLVNDPQVAPAPQCHRPHSGGALESTHPHLAGGQVVNPGEHIDQGGLARPGLADDGHELAAMDIQVNPLEGVVGSSRGFVGFLNPAQSNERFFRHGYILPRSPDKDSTGCWSL